MEKLCDTFYDFIESQQKISENFLKKYSSYIMNVHGAQNYLKRIIFCFNTDLDNQSTYNYRTKNIDVYINTFLINLEDDLEEKFDPSKFYHIMRYNILLLHAITHECMHGIQFNVIENGCDSFVRQRIFIDSYKWFKKNYDLYSFGDFYCIEPLETNAEIEAKIMTNLFINLLADEEIVFNNNRELAESILGIYTHNEKIISPTEIFYKQIDKAKHYESIVEKEILSNYERMLLGLPLDDYFLGSLESIRDGKTEVNDVKKYLKKL